MSLVWLCSRLFGAPSILIISEEVRIAFFVSPTVILFQDKV